MKAINDLVVVLDIIAVVIRISILYSFYSEGCSFFFYFLFVLDIMCSIESMKLITSSNN